MAGRVVELYVYRTFIFAVERPDYPNIIPDLHPIRFVQTRNI